MKSEEQVLMSIGSRWHFDSLRPLIVGWLLSFLVCGVVSFAFGWQMWHALSISSAELFRVVGRDWLIWSFAIPVIFIFAQRFPIERNRWRAVLPLHAVVSIALLLAIGWIGQSSRLKDGRHRMEEKDGERMAEQGENLKHPPKPQTSPIFSLFFGPHLPIYFAVLSAAHATCFYRRGQEREMRAFELSASLAKARLQALRMQIQPHFLFNSLNALGALIQKDARAADDMLAAISDFLRLTIDGATEQEVPLRRELEYVESYLTIEKTRFGDRLGYLVSASPDTLAAHVPALLLQPLIENAVRHGIEPKQGAGSITIRSWQNGQTLHVTVEDDGVGLKAMPTEGIGLSNIRSRLRELYGDEACLSLGSREGTRVEVCLPLRFA